MKQSLTLKSNEKPSFFNKELVVGLIAGMFLGPAGAAVGATIGGLIGKSRSEQKAATGKTVNPPSAWNKDTFIGTGIGLMIGGASAIAMLPFSIAAASALLVTGTISAGALGSKRGKRIQTEEYEQALRQWDQNKTEQNKQQTFYHPIPSYPEQEHVLEHDIPYFIKQSVEASNHDDLFEQFVTSPRSKSFRQRIIDETKRNNKSLLRHQEIEPIVVAQALEQDVPHRSFADTLKELGIDVTHQERFNRERDIDKDHGLDR